MLVDKIVDVAQLYTDHIVFVPKPGQLCLSHIVLYTNDTWPTRSDDAVPTQLGQ